MLGTSPSPAAAATVTAFPDNAPLAVAYRGAEYFVGGEGRTRGLYRSDGTPAGTKLVARDDVRYATALEGLTVVADRLVFSTTTSAGAPGTVYVSDGTAAGTHRALAIQGLSTRAGELSRRGPRTRREDRESDRDLAFDRPMVAGDRLYVAGSRNAGTETLYRVDLTSGAIAPVVGEAPGLRFELGSFRALAATPDGGLFFSYWGSDEELWHVGPSGPARRLAPLAYGVKIAALGERLYFTSSDPAHGVEPWVTDGTPERTRMVADLTPGQASSRVDDLVPTRDAMYAIAAPQTPKDAERVPYLLTGPGEPAPVTLDSAAARVAIAAGRPDALWFSSGPPTAAVRLRVASGSAVAERTPGPGFDENGVMVVPGTPFYVSGGTLRRTDDAGVTTILATPALPHMAKAGPEDPIASLSSAGDAAWFFSSVIDGAGGVLWRSDGTVAGTHPAVTPGQVRPLDSAISAVVSPPRGGPSPRWTVSGTVQAQEAPADVAPSLCAGTVSLTVSRVRTRRALERRHVPVRWTGTTCVFRGTAAPSGRTRRIGRGQLTISIGYDGTDHLRPSYHEARRRIRY